VSKVHVQGLKNTNIILVGKSERKRVFGRPKHKCYDNIKVTQEIGCGVGDCI
jgi:hypothetical protein